MQSTSLHPVSRHLRETVRLSIPVIIGQLGSLLMNIMDNIMVGNVSYLHLSAASLANSTYFIITILAIGTMNALAPLVSEAHGAEDYAKGGRYLPQGVWTALIVGLVSGMLTWWMAGHLHWLQQPEEDIALARSYLKIISVSTPLMLVFLAFKQFCDGVGRTTAGMVITIAGLMFNGLANWLLIYGNLGFPRMELDGSGYATLMARGFMLVLILVHVFSSPRYKQWLQAIDHWRFHQVEVWRIFRLGFPMGLQIFFEVAAFSGASIMMGWLPNASVARAAHQIVLNLSGLSFMVAVGFAVGGSIRVGNALGRKDFTNLRRAGDTTLALVAVYMTCSAIIFVIFRKVFPLLYGIYEPAVLAVTARLMVIAALFQVFDGVQAAAAGLLRGLQDVRYPTLMTFTAYWLIWAPLAYLLGFPLKLGAEGIWYADVIALAFAAITLTLRFWRLTHPKRRQASQEEPELRGVAV